MLRAPRVDDGASREAMQRKETGSAEPGDYARLFLIRTARCLHFVEEHSIEWIEAAANYTQFHVSGIVHTARETIKSVEARLTPGMFVRVHRSAIVNVSCMRAIERTPAGDYVLTLKGGARVPVSRSQRRAVRQMLSALVQRNAQPPAIE